MVLLPVVVGRLHDASRLPPRNEVNEWLATNCEWCVCVSVLFSTMLHSAPPRGDPGQLLLCDSWLKLIADCPPLLGKLVFESRVPFDGITQFSPGVSSCRGFVHLSGW